MCMFVCFFVYVLSGLEAGPLLFLIVYSCCHLHACVFSVFVFFIFSVLFFSVFSISARVRSTPWSALKGERTVTV